MGFYIKNKRNSSSQPVSDKWS